MNLHFISMEESNISYLLYLCPMTLRKYIQRDFKTKNAVFFLHCQGPFHFCCGVWILNNGHWYTHSLLTGSYLLSGGHECVLVKWQYNSHHRELLPRMGAPIRFLACSPDNTTYATAHTDNGKSTSLMNSALFCVFWFWLCHCKLEMPLV